MKQLFAILIILLPLTGFSQNSEPLSIAQYRDMYSAAELIEYAEACNLDWQPYYEAFLSRQKQLAAEQNLPLENRARLELELRNTRERLAKNISPSCTEKQRDSIAVRLEIELEKLVAEEDPDDENWVLKPRGRNWISIQRVIPDLRDKYYLRKSLEAIDEEIEFRLVENWGINGKVRWHDYPAGSEAKTAKPWVIPSNDQAFSAFFLNLRPFLYRDESMSVLAARAELEHVALGKAADLGRAQKYSEAGNLLEELEEDSYLKNLPGYWIMRSKLELDSGDRYDARKHIRSIAGITPRRARDELMMRYLLVALEDEYRQHWKSHYLGLIIEINYGDKAEVLMIYQDGEIIFAFGNGGGVSLEPFSRPRLGWNVQKKARSLLLTRNRYTQTPLGIKRESETTQQFPEPGFIRLTFLNGFTDVTEIYPVEYLEERKTLFWRQLFRIHAILDAVYQSAEVER